MTKITKAQMFEAISALATSGAAVYGEGATPVTPEAIAEFCDKEIDALARKAAKAKETAAKKRAETDALSDVVAGILTEEPLTIDEIVTIINDETITRGKVTNRLSKLVTAGRAAKTEVSVDDGGKKRKLSAYTMPLATFEG